MPPRRRPGARQKLNAAHLCGAATLAGGVGLVTGSIEAAVLAAAVLLAAAVHAGDIR